MTAPAGRGKSALLVRWITSLQERGLAEGGESGWHVVFVPISIRVGTNLPSIFYAALASRLAAVMHEPRLAAPSTDAEAYYADHAARLLRRVASADRRVLVIIDGIDESLRGGFDPGIFPRAIPKQLKVVLSARLQAEDTDATGWLRRLGWEIGVRVETLDLDALDGDRIADVLVKMGAPLDVMSSRRPLTERLAHLSEGEPLLLRYYAEDLWQRGEAVRHLCVEDLDAMKPGFAAYFQRWLNDQEKAWRQEGADVDPRAIDATLAILACAFGPLEGDDLARLVHDVHGGPSVLSTQRLLEPLRRFVMGVRGADTQAGYVLSHPKIAQYLREERLDSSTVQKTLQGFVQWGRMTVEELNEGRISPEQVPAYLLQFYQQHLKGVGACYEPFLELVTDRWRRAWYTYEGGYSGFAGDVRAAFVSLTRREPIDEETIRFVLVHQIRSALVLSSICGLGSKIPPDLLRAGVEENVISIQRAARLAEMRSGDNHVDALIPLAHFLPKPSLDTIIEETKAITRPETKATYLIALAAHVTEKQRKAILPKVLETARSINDPGARMRCLLDLLPHLTNRLYEEVVSEAGTAAAAIQDGYTRALCLADLAWHSRDRSDLLRFQAVLAASGVPDNRRRALGLIDLSQRLPEDQRSAVLGMALSAAVSAFLEIGRAGGEPMPIAFHLANDARKAYAIALASLAQHLPRTQEELAIQESLRVVRAIPAQYSRVETMTRLASLLPHKFRGEVISSAYEQALSLPSANNRNHALTKLIPVLPTYLRSQAISEAFEAARAEAIEEESERVHILCGIVGQFEDERSREALAMYIYELVFEHHATAMTDDLVRVASYVPQDRRNALYQRALEVAKAGAQLFELARLSPVLPEPLKGLAVESLAEMAENASKIRSGIELAGVAQAVPLLPEERRLAIVQRAVISASELRDPYLRATDLADLLPYVPEEQRAGVVNSALKSARTVPSEEARVRALAKVAGKLPPAESAPVLEEAAKLARAVPDDQKRAQLLVELAPGFPLDEKERALNEALLIAVQSKSVHLLRRLADLLPERKTALIARAVVAAREMTTVDTRTSAFLALMDYLSGPEKVEALQSILDKCSRQPRGNTLGSLRAAAPTLADVGGDQLLLATIDAVRETAAWWHRSTGGNL